MRGYNYLLAMAAALIVLCASAGPAMGSTCSNEALRGGLSAELPDCRAYELVSPPDSNGRMLETISTFTLGRVYDMFPTELASPVRDSVVYETYASPLQNLPGANGAFDTYEAERDVTGWKTVRRLTLPLTSAALPRPGGISPDHAYTFASVGGTDYLGQPDGSFELTGVGSLGSEPRVQGRFISEGGQHVIFTSGKAETQSFFCSGCPVKRLEPDAPPDGTGAVYDRAADGATHVVSLLPTNQPPVAGEEAFYRGASRDGSSVAFAVGGTLYVRVDNQITEEVAAGDPTFAGLSEEGRFVFFVSGGTIRRLNTETEMEVDVNPTGEGEIVNISADGSHVYFISEQQLDGTKGTLGQPNLYVWRGGSPEYITTVAPSDLVRTSGTANGLPALTNWTSWVTNPQIGSEQGPGADSSRTTPDGSIFVFESRAQLSSYDNASHTEIYRYDDGDGSLTCVSCNSTVEPAVGDARLQELHLVGPPFIIHNVTDDGSRIFFETDEELVERDTNSGNDIYEWQRAGDEASHSLISSGKSPEYPLPAGWESPFAPLSNLLLSITPDGSDVLFTAKDVLVDGAGESGTQALYDARVGGGLAQAPPLPSCTEEGCRPSSPASAPSFASPQSEAIRSSGNVTSRRHRACRRKRDKAKGRKRHRCHGHKSKRHRATASVAHSVMGTLATQKLPLTAESSTRSEMSRVTEAPAEQAKLGPVVNSTSTEFQIETAEAGLSPAQAGLHPDFTTNLVFSENGEGSASERVQKVTVSLPAGLLGLPTATPRCSMGDFVSFGNCPTDSQVGLTRVRVGDPLFTSAVEPIYNLMPPHPKDEVARLGFIGDLFPVFIDIKVRTAGDYGVTATVVSAPSIGTLMRAKTTLWGNPASATHDKERLTPFEAVNCPLGVACKVPNGERASGIPVNDRKGFLTNPSACQDGQVDFEVETYQEPGQIYGASASLPSITDCVGLPFAPAFQAEPTSHIAGAPTGLKTTLKIPQHLGPEEKATATMREARVTLPEGMQVAAGAANWIGTCSEEQVRYHQEVDATCPDNSKLGTATILSPALSEPIEGAIYQRAPRPGHQFGLWLVVDALGLHVKLPGDLEPDPQSGRLTAAFRDLPQVPVEEIDLDVWGGPRAPLQNPDHCGTFVTDFSFAPHSNDPAFSGQTQMQINEGCDQGFSPTLHAGVDDPVAGHFSPFTFDFNREDGQQALRGLELHLPDGEVAKVKGVLLCPDAAAAAGNCPDGSRIGSAQATTGPGPEPLQIPQPGKAQPAIYLAGPYQGAPYSIVTEVPAQAGPFDLGVLAVRSALEINPETAQVTVKADPLPQFFEGVGIAYRHIHVVADRPEFNLNPTDCREMAVTSDVTSTQGAVAHPAARFQVEGCKALKFKPSLSLRLRGGTKRGDYPAFTATLKARKGDANLDRTSVGLPHSEFLAQEHINTICTRVQFAADKCPKGSIYGKAKAWSPLLDKPLEGPVYLRSSSHPLPDMVVALRGQIEIDLVGRIDSHHGGIRSTFDTVPDAPVSKFVLQMKGGKKGLLVNSTDICQGKHRAAVSMRAQNGRVRNFRPGLASTGCGNGPGKKHKHHR